MLSQDGAEPTSQEWIGLCKILEDIMPKWVVSVGYFKEVNLGPMQFSADFMGTFPKFAIGSQYFYSHRGETDCKECGTTRGYLRMGVAS